jgi:hypothetical protein
MGNALTDGIENCWNNMNKIYQNHWKDEYGLLCDKCDEWWVFNL